MTQSCRLKVCQSTAGSDLLWLSLAAVYPCDEVLQRVTEELVVPGQLVLSDYSLMHRAALCAPNQTRCMASQLALIPQMLHPLHLGQGRKLCFSCARYICIGHVSSAYQLSHQPLVLHAHSLSAHAINLVCGAQGCC